MESDPVRFGVTAPEYGSAYAGRTGYISPEEKFLSAEHPLLQDIDPVMARGGQGQPQNRGSVSPIGMGGGGAADLFGQTQGLVSPGGPEEEQKRKQGGMGIGT
jgi:hypothetical protein